MTTFSITFRRRRKRAWDTSEWWVRLGKNDETLCWNKLAKYFAIPDNVRVIHVHISSILVHNAYKGKAAAANVHCSHSDRDEWKNKPADFFKTYDLKIDRSKTLNMDIHVGETLTEHGLDPTKPFWFWIEYDVPVAKPKAKAVA